jgi:hypothetical protein
MNEKAEAIFSNKGIINEYNEFIKKTESQKEFNEKINKISLGIIFSSSFVLVTTVIAVTVIVIGVILEAWLLNVVLVKVLVASFVVLLVAAIILIIGICIGLCMPSKENFKQPFLFERSSGMFPFADGEEAYSEEIYSVIEKLYKDIYEMEKFESKFIRKTNLEKFEKFKKYYFSQRDLRWIRDRINKICVKLENKKEIFIKDAFKIISSKRSYEKKIELIEFHPLITITNCYKELCLDVWGYNWNLCKLLVDSYFSMFSEHVESFKDDTEFFNSLVIKMFEKVTDSTIFNIEAAEKVVKYVKTKKQMEDIIKQMDLIEDAEFQGVNCINFPKVVKDEIIKELKRAWQEKTKEKI